MIYGLAVDAVKPAQCTVEIASNAAATVLEMIAEGVDGVAENLEMGKEFQERQLELDLFADESDWELRQMGRELQGKIREEQELRLAVFLAADAYGGAQLDYDTAVQKGFRKLAELIRMRKRWAGQVMSGRYNDMAYRIEENAALQKYRQQFNLAQLYTYMTAAAYDYETNLKGEDPAAGEKLLRGITAERSLGELRWTTGPWDVEPIVGSGGLAEVLGKLRDNFRVLKGQMGFNNPQSQAIALLAAAGAVPAAGFLGRQLAGHAAAVLHAEHLREPGRAEAGEEAVRRNRPPAGAGDPVRLDDPQGLNYFGQPLGTGDGAYNPTQFATKIASVGVWFEGYDTERLARMPYVYLLPVGKDVLRPRNADGTLRYWPVREQLLPLPYPITQSDIENPAGSRGWTGCRGGCTRSSRMPRSRHSRIQRT